MLQQNTIKNSIGTLAMILSLVASATAQQTTEAGLAMTHEISEANRTASPLSGKVKVNDLNMYYKLAGIGEKPDAGLLVGPQ